MYRHPLNPDPRRYLELHKGVTITDEGQCFVLDKDIVITEENGQFLIQSVCTMLNERGLCMIYNDRPEVCRNFTSETAEHFNVPKSCMYAPEAVEENKSKGKKK